MANDLTEQQEDVETASVKSKVEEAGAPQRKELLFSNFLGKEFADLLVDTMTSAFKSGLNILTLSEFLRLLLTRSEVADYNKENNIEASELLANLQEPEAMENQNRGIIVLSPNLKAKILQIFAYGIHNNETIVTALSFWQAYVAIENNKKVNTLQQELPQVAKYLTKMLPAEGNEVVGREVEVDSVLRILMKQEKQHVIMVGDFGIGKSAIVAKLIAKLNEDNGNTDPTWKNYEFYKVNSSELISLIKYQLDFQEDYFAELGKTEHKVFYFPDIDLEPIGRDPMVIEFLFSIFMKNPTNRVIIGCSIGTYQKIVTRINFFGKFFEVVNIQEPTASDLKEIINNKLAKYRDGQGFSFSADLAEDIIDYSKRFIPAKVFPHKALNLLDEVIVESKLQQKTEITSENVKMVLAQKTGIPIQSIGVGEKETLLQLEDKMNQVIIGQQLAVKEVVQSIQRSRVGLKNPNHPTGSFLFMGPTGVGKTEFAKQLARIYFNDEKAFMRFDMSEYSEPQASQKLIGAPPGFTGYDEGGTLTNYVGQHPYSLLLFDEVEKADPHIYDLFLQILDDGRLTDAKGVLVDFKNTILIFTSNIGSDIIAEKAIDRTSQLYADTKGFFNEEIFPLLSKFMRVEFINRFDMIIPFVPLNEEDIYKILLLKLERIKTAITKQGYKIAFDDAGLHELVKLGYDPKFGAREIDRVINAHIENQITTLLLNSNLKPGDTIIWKYK